jgi:hypothetical protein
MAKAQFHKNQKVWVECVGAWATIERIVPVWAKGFDEPVRISYDVGLGREFAGNELEAEKPDEVEAAKDLGAWRLLRAKNKWQTPEDCSHHPFPGTYPVVVTDANDWGGWRVPGAEYDRDPHKIEFQARLVAAAPKLMQLTEELIAVVSESPEEAPPVMIAMARKAEALLRGLLDGSAPAPRAAEPAAEPPARAAAPAEPKLRAVPDPQADAPPAAAPQAGAPAPAREEGVRGEDITARLRQRLQRFTA